MHEVGLSIKLPPGEDDRIAHCRYRGMTCLVRWISDGQRLRLPVTIDILVKEALTFTAVGEPGQVQQALSICCDTAAVMWTGIDLPVIIRDATHPPLVYICYCEVSSIGTKNIPPERNRPFIGPGQRNPAALAGMLLKPLVC